MTRMLVPRETRGVRLSENLFTTTQKWSRDLQPFSIEYKVKHWLGESMVCTDVVAHSGSDSARYKKTAYNNTAHECRHRKNVVVVGAADARQFRLFIRINMIKISFMRMLN